MFILGPSHHAHLSKCSISGFDSLVTPLGNLQIDKTIREELLQTGVFDTIPSEVDEEEHSIEMHLSFLYKAMEGRSHFTVIPIMVDSLDPGQLCSTSDLLAKYIDEGGNLFIISSDFCHWGKRFGYRPYDASKVITYYISYIYNILSIYAILSYSSI